MKSPHLPQYDRFVGMRDCIGELLEMLCTTDARICESQQDETPSPPTKKGSFIEENSTGLS